ncbi:PAS domain-containing sensor histidine kinase [Leeuwenhoekiella sp. MAR_2009_132]|uniref:PAS domain-containing sensor histidine kinase n=1 Tax=Leeuwenhoekiella sp. MAR_2009_132 TaxID=1392489 RepID=UPI0004904014|nr:PAS domain-containing sensor histidine kinase [Leeuwenhoekiella sp. MAR_2009_132]
MDTVNLEVYKRIIERERAARKMAESILEAKSSELYSISQELKKSNDRLQSSIYQKNSELKGLFESLVDAYVVIDLEGYVLKMNSAAVKLLGYDATLETVFLPNLVPASEKDKVATGFKDLIKSGNITDFKITIVTKEQKNCLVHINASVICDENGNIVAAQGIVRDITSEEKKAQIIKEQKRQLEFIVNSSPLGIALTTNGLIDHCNASFTRILGYSEEYIKGKSLKSITVAAEQSDYEEKSALLHQGDLDSFSTTIKYITNLGEIITTKINVSSVKDHNDLRLRQEVVTIEDVTKELLAQEKLKESENRLSALILKLQSGILLEDENRKVVLTNPMFCEMFGVPMTPEAMIGLDCQNAAEQAKDLFINPQDFINRIAEILENRQLVTGDELVLKDGRIFSRDFVPVYSNEKYKGHLWSYTDVTLNRRYKDNLQKQKEKYSSIIANMNLGLLEVDIEDRILMANQSFCELSGYSEEELLGKQAAQIFLNEDSATVIKEKHAVRSNGVSDSYEVEAIIKNGERRNWLISGAPNFDINGKLIGSIGIHLDITDLKNLEQQKESLLKTLEKSNQELEEYAHVVSHDLKSPLRSINALASWIKEDNAAILDAQSLENFDILESTLEKMENLISGILNYSSIQIENIKDEDTDVNVIIKDIQELIFVPDHINIITATNLPTINVDRTRLQQVFQNLIGNAIRYSDKEEGIIEIGYQEDAEYYIFSVKDNGIGIEEKYHEKIFNIFQSLTDHKESTGIGLSIVKKIVNLYQGRIWVESTPTVGSTFYFSLKKS